jgi:hypothetical protein
MTRSRKGGFVSVLLAVVAFVLSHQLVFWYTYGSAADAALARTGHGLAWSTTVPAVFATGLALAVIAAVELCRLARRARDVAAMQMANPATADESWKTLVDRALRDAVTIGVLAAAILVLTENVEHSAIGAPLPGLGVFNGPEYSGTVPILVAVALAFSVVRALYHWRRDVLIERLRAARPRLPRATAVMAREPHGANLRPRTNIGGRIHGRAPPAPALN